MQVGAATMQNPAGPYDRAFSSHRFGINCIT
jgi:hypothetical protein